MQAAVSTTVIDGMDFARGARVLAEAGATEVEPAYIDGYTPFDEATFSAANGRAVAALFAAEGLSIRAMSAHTDLGRADGADRLLRRLTFAAAMGAGTVISNATASGNLDGLLRTLETVVPELEAAGIVLALENPGHGSEALLPDGAAGASFVASFGSPWVRFNYDIGNAVTYSGGRIDLAADLAAVRGQASRLHLKDVAVTGADWTFCPIGEGFVGYGERVDRSVLEGLPLTVEHPIRLHRPGRGDPVRRAEAPTEAEIRVALAASATALDRLLSGD
ncbi:Sugar phosphate isomerase/epimerase [Paracoccus tibetensis]|uniref:Sugar phosphate isomerase/epimerase n=2 Tax=Paracoccus tibetensis TaxID=336292 RepID=A0A1G5HPB2_9RHOB|nr:Sugar phosphate isomerase/epimerase [Paracoccus tibetensis]